MNSLSWFFYFSDIFASLKTTAALGVFVGVCLLICTPPKGVAIFGPDHKFASGMLMFWPWFVTIVALALVIFIPAKETMYLIASSQIGEQVSQLEEVKKLGGDLGELASSTIELLNQNIQAQLNKP